MKKMKIGNDTYVEVQMDDMFTVPGGPTFKVKKIKAMKCLKTGDFYVDALTLQKRDHAALAWLIRDYSHTLQVPGKTADWIRKVIHLSLSEWANLSCGMNPSAFSQAAKRNSIIDRYAAFVLINLASDYLTGNKKGRLMIENSKKVVDESLPVEVALEVA